MPLLAAPPVRFCSPYRRRHGQSPSTGLFFPARLWAKMLPWSVLDVWEDIRRLKSKIAARVRRLSMWGYKGRSELCDVFSLRLSKAISTRSTTRASSRAANNSCFIVVDKSSYLLRILGCRVENLPQARNRQIIPWSPPGGSGQGLPGLRLYQNIISSTLNISTILHRNK